MAHILIADDDELIAAMASDFLIDAGHACGWVTNADEAWDAMERRRPDVLLLDQDMPGMSGVTLLRKLRSSDMFYDLPVIMFTAMRGEADENRAIYAGAVDYIRKPFRQKRLLDCVDRVLLTRQGRHLDLKSRIARDAGMLEVAKPLSRRCV